MSSENSAIIIGGGLAGLVAAYELSQRKIPSIIIDQENDGNLGGQAFWSLGGIFIVNSAEQRRLGIKDSKELALADWMNTAKFDREKEDYWPRQWAKAFVDFAADGMEEYVKGRGMGFVGSVGWAERGGGSASGHGNSVPRFHLTWGTGPEVVRVFEEPVRAAAKEGLITFKFRHRVDRLLLDDSGAAIGVQGCILEPSDVVRGASSSRKEVDKFTLYGSAILVSSGGIGGNVSLVQKNWPTDRLGPSVPKNFVVGVPAHVDGRMLEIAEDAGANIVNADRMWHYTEGLQNWDPIWPMHGIRVIPGPSSMWLDATGKRLPPFLYPGCDTLATLKHICSTGHDYTWFVLNKTIIQREFGLSGSEQNPDVTGKSWYLLLWRILGSNPPVESFMNHGKDFVVRSTLPELVEGMNILAKQADGPALDLDTVRREIDIRDAQVDNKYTKDAQLMLINNARNYFPDKISRVAKPHKLLDHKHGPLIAVKMNLLTRKSLGGLETDLDANVRRPDGSKFPNLYAAGEVAGFGGGGVHGYSSLEGTFLGGCIFSGRTAGIAISEQLSKQFST
ncbi:hypothetical protein MRB53_039836 [Persea americana]|nr:hypothetical protein MRB53_039836 [Persea americana]